MKIEIARLYERTNKKGVKTLSGRFGYTGRLRIEPNPQHDPNDERSPQFIAYVEEHTAFKPLADAQEGKQ
jgi:hypothetical protein